MSQVQIETRELSRISCLADINVVPSVMGTLSDMRIPEVLVQRAKQISLVERSRVPFFARRTICSEDRAEFIRFYAPKVHESAIMRRVAESADLFLPGRGSIYAEDATVRRIEWPVFDDQLLGEVLDDAKPGGEHHSVLCCIVQRGMAKALALTVLEMGLCVPIVSFGEGMGLRNKLGLLRVTIPVDKEVIYFIVPERDADLLEGIAVHKARLDMPGQGFIYRYPVRARAVNLRVLRGKRSSAASMEQVIAALDELRGSSEWRRLAPGKMVKKPQSPLNNGLVCLSLVAEDGAVGEFVRAAMEAGAGGATLVPLDRITWTGSGNHESHARETCDLIIPKDLETAVLEAVTYQGLFNPEVHGIAETTQVQKAVTYTG